MPKIKLTAKSIASLKAPDPSGKQVLHWDTVLRGFGVLCSGKTNGKSFVVQRELPNGRSPRVTIGAANVLKLDEARRRAETILADMYKGIDPKAARREGLTLREALDKYVKDNKELRAGSIGNYEFSITQYLGVWLDRPLRTITQDMVQARHRKIAAEVEERQVTLAKESAKRFEERAVRAEARGWPEAAARHRAAAAAALARKPPNGFGAANGAVRALRLLWSYHFPDAPNPARLKRQWFPLPPRERLLRADDLPAFYTAVLSLENKVARDYLLLLLFTGLRRTEAASLTWDRVDFAGRLIRLSHARTKAGRKLDLPMTDFVRDLLVARRALGDAKFVFPASSNAGHIVEPKFPLDQVHAETGIRVSAHDLRRTFVTVAESTDISPIALKALVNHSLGKDVTSGYVVMTVERLREPAQRVCDRIKSFCGIGAIETANIAKLG
jgi:integrase